MEMRGQEQRFMGQGSDDCAVQLNGEAMEMRGLDERHFMELDMDDCAVQLHELDARGQRLGGVIPAIVAPYFKAGANTSGDGEMQRISGLDVEELREESSE